MKVLFMLLISLFFPCKGLAADRLDQLCENIKVRDVKFTFENAQPDQLWTWIQLNFDLVANSQVEWGARKFNEKLTLKVISGIHDNITINGQMSLLKAINIVLEKYHCVAVINFTSVAVIPRDIKLDKDKYILVEGAIYRVKSELK